MYMAVGHLRSSIGPRFDGDYFWHVPKTNSIGTAADEPAAKLAAETELRRLASEMVEALGGAVRWQPDAARPQEEQQ